MYFDTVKAKTSYVCFKKCVKGDEKTSFIILALF